MQDRFRFRAWHNRYNKYIYDIQNVGADFSINCWEDCFGDFLCEDYVIEQCTGLKDKNNKLIYEGDIVAKEFSDKPFSSKAKSKIKNCLVYWHERGEFSIKYNSDNYRCYSTPHDSFIGDCEVIGNIHENPELLEK